MTSELEAALAALSKSAHMGTHTIAEGDVVRAQVNVIREALQQLPEVEELAEEPPVEESPIYIAPWERAILGHPDAPEDEPMGGVWENCDATPTYWEGQEETFAPAEEEPRADD